MVLLLLVAVAVVTVVVVVAAVAVVTVAVVAVVAMVVATVVDEGAEETVVLAVELSIFGGPDDVTSADEFALV